MNAEKRMRRELRDVADRIDRARRVVDDWPANVEEAQRDDVSLQQLKWEAERRLGDLDAMIKRAIEAATTCPACGLGDECRC